MYLNDYPHITIIEDGRLCSTGQHRLGFLRVLYDALLRLGYNGDIPIYRYRMSTAHGLDRCEVSMTMTIIGVELDDTVEQMTHVALNSLCESRLAATAVMPIMLFLIRNQGDPVWKQCAEAVSDPEGPHFHAGMAVISEYAQHSFNLQHNLSRTVIQQRLSMAAYDEHENALLHRGTLPPSNQDCELRSHTVTSARLSTGG
jgi:hypothetical protein